MSILSISEAITYFKQAGSLIYDYISLLRELIHLSAPFILIKRIFSHLTFPRSDYEYL